MGTTEIIAIFVIIGFFAINMYRMSSGQALPEEIYKAIPNLLAKGELVGLDVRSPGEVSRTPATKAKNIPVGDIEAKASSLSKEKIYVVFCQSGGRASMAANQMKKKGFEKVYNLGTWRKWNEAVSQSS